MDWHPWGEEALAEARERDAPLLVSIGYSACHWCHVMERESFEDPEVAAYMNERFVCIKVDREERPDVDAIYMDAVQAMTGRGGWPLNAFTTPEQVPFYAGTYFPPETRHGMPSWMMVLEAVAKAWDERREEIRAGGGRIVERLQGAAALPASSEPIEPRELDAAVESLRADLRPGPRRLRRRPQVPALLGDRVPSRPGRNGDVAGHAARDGGGRHPRPGRRRVLPLRGRRHAGRSRTSRRCSTTTRCSRGPTCTASRSPATTSSGARAATRSTGPCARCVAPRAGSTRRSTPTPRASRAATTSGRWTSCATTLGDLADDAIAWFGATERGNFEGANVLEAHGPVPEARDEIRARLYEARERRVRPGLDDKRLASWNALMLAALAEAGAVLERDDYREAAVGVRRVPPRRAARRAGPPAAHLEGRPRAAGRLPRGPRIRGRGAPRPLRGHVRRPLVRRGAGARRRHDRRLRRPGARRLLLHGRRRRGAARPPQGPRGHADPQRLVERGAGPAAPGRADRRGRVRAPGRGGAAPRPRGRAAASAGLRPPAPGDGVLRLAFAGGRSGGRRPASARARRARRATVRTSSWPAERGTSRCSRVARR